MPHRRMRPRIFGDVVGINLNYHAVAPGQGRKHFRGGNLIDPRPVVYAAQVVIRVIEGPERIAELRKIFSIEDSADIVGIIHVYPNDVLEVFRNPEELAVDKNRKFVVGGDFKKCVSDKPARGATDDIRPSNGPYNSSAKIKRRPAAERLEK